MDSFIK